MKTPFHTHDVHGISDYEITPSACRKEAQGTPPGMHARDLIARASGKPERRRRNGS